MIGLTQFLESTGDVALLVRPATATTPETLRLVSDHGVRHDAVGPEAGRAAVAALVLAERQLWVGCVFAWSDRVLAGGDSFGVDLLTVRSWLPAARVVVPGGFVVGESSVGPFLPPVSSFGEVLRGLDSVMRSWVDAAVAEDTFWRGRDDLKIDRSELARVLQRKEAEVDAFSRLLGFDLMPGGRSTAAWLRGYGMTVGSSFDDVKAKNVNSAGSTMPVELWDAFLAAARPLSQVHALVGFAKHLQGDVVRPRFYVNKAVTGRMSSTMPNIQGLTGEARGAVLAPAGREFWSADHVSAEIAVLAAAVGNPSLVGARDLYQEVGDAMDGVERKLAKIGVLAWLYGQGTAARAKLFGSVELAQAFEAAVGVVLSDVVEYRRSLEARVTAGERLHTLAGRPLAFLTGRDKFKALNLVVQGSARDAFGAACRNVAASAGQLSLQLSIPMHDEVILTAPIGSDPEAVSLLLHAQMGVVLPGGLVQMRSDVAFLGSRWGQKRI